MVLSGGGRAASVSGRHTKPITVLRRAGQLASLPLASSNWTRRSRARRPFGCPFRQTSNWAGLGRLQTVSLGAHYFHHLCSTSKRASSAASRQASTLGPNATQMIMSSRRRCSPLAYVVCFSARECVPCSGLSFADLSSSLPAEEHTTSGQFARSTGSGRTREGEPKREREEEQASANWEHLTATQMHERKGAPLWVPSGRNSARLRAQLRTRWST